MSVWIVVAVAVVLLTGLLLTVCRAKTMFYRVDYCGNKMCYSNAKDFYKSGTTVELFFDLLATDTDYTFCLDGARDALDITWQNNGYVIRFVMPEHDVKLDFSTRNSMEYIPEESENRQK